MLHQQLDCGGDFRMGADRNPIEATHEALTLLHQTKFLGGIHPVRRNPVNGASRLECIGARVAGCHVELIEERLNFAVWEM